MIRSVRLNLWFLLVQEHEIGWWWRILLRPATKVEPNHCKIISSRTLNTGIVHCKNRFFYTTHRIVCFITTYIQIKLLECLLCILQFYGTHCIYLFKTFRCAILTWNLTTWRTTSRNIFRFINLKKKFLKKIIPSRPKGWQRLFFWLCNSKICTRFLSLFLCCWSEYIEFRANIISQW